ncbi:MAG: response regulator transcription factor [Acidimicrobiales bacterium]
MARLNAAHAHEFGVIRELCYRGLDSVTLRDRVGDRLARRLGASSYCFGATDPRTALPVHSVSVGLDPAATDRFFCLVLTTPSLDFGPWIDSGRRAATLEQLVEDVEADPYVTDILRPSGLGPEVQVACAAGGWSWGHLCLRRDLHGAPFAGHEVRFLDALAPHLTAGLRAAARRAPTAAAQDPSCGVVVLGPDGRVEVANGVAERLFRQPISGTRHSFLTAVNLVAARLERLLTGGADDAVPSLTMADEATGVVYRLRAERTVGADGRARGVVLIEPTSSSGPDDQLLALARCGLSQREGEVALAIVRGKTTAEIAEDLVVSAHTVADHVRNIFDKLGVASRQQLAFRVVGIG